MTDNNQTRDVQLVDEAPSIPSMRAQVSPEMATQIMLAKQFPRNERRNIDKAIQLATESKDVAEGCFYSLPPRGGSSKRIAGPSVRLAEIMAATYENLHVVVRVGEEADRYVTAQATAYDMQNLASVSVEKRRRITNKFGERYSDDMIQNTANAAASIAFRDAVFRIIPKSFVMQAYERARSVALDGAKSMAERRQIALRRWKEKGVEEKTVLDHLGYKKVDEITIDDLDYFTGLFSGLKDKDYDIEDIFSAPRDGGKPEREEASVSAGDVSANTEQPKESEKASAKTSPKPVSNAQARREEAGRGLSKKQVGELRAALLEEVTNRVVPTKEWDAMCEELGLEASDLESIPGGRLTEVIDAAKKRFAPQNPPDHE